MSTPSIVSTLQQHLPLAVLKQSKITPKIIAIKIEVATALTACGIETTITISEYFKSFGCNSTYRLRY